LGEDQKEVSWCSSSSSSSLSSSSSSSMGARVCLSFGGGSSTIETKQCLFCNNGKNMHKSKQFKMNYSHKQHLNGLMASVLVASSSCLLIKASSLASSSSIWSYLSLFCYLKVIISISSKFQERLLSVCRGKSS